MEELKKELKEISRKLDDQKEVSTFNKLLRLSEKLIIPLILGGISFYSLWITNDLGEKSLAETKRGNIILERFNNKTYKLDSIKHYASSINSNDKSEENLAISIIESKDIKFVEQIIEELRPQATIDKVPDKGIEIARKIARNKYKEEEDKIESKFDNLSAKLERTESKEDSLQISSELNKIEKSEEIKLNSRLETYDRNKEILRNLSNDKFDGDLIKEKDKFWKLYWGNMIKYENKETEALMVKFGKKLKSNTEDYDLLTTISNQIIGAMASQTQESNWVRESYFRPHNNFRIWLVDLDAKEKKANFHIKMGDKLIEKGTLTPTKYFTFTHEKVKYKLTLNSIGKAGRNPLTKAAFFTIEDFE
ncbi:MAG: hypothetical protein JKY48_16885 [Flavobacteriales bacterium]|nr:hypothetical protein [Flavobacteriales bacterium]